MKLSFFRGENAHYPPPIPYTLDTYIVHTHITVQFCKIISVFCISRHPRQNAKDWFKASLAEIDDPRGLNREVLGFKIPALGPEDVFAINDLNSGGYGLKEARKYFLLLRDRELKDFKEDWDELNIQRRKPPQDTLVYFRVLKKKPKTWCDDKFGKYVSVTVILTSNRLITTFGFDFQISTITTYCLCTYSIINADRGQKGE